MSDQIERLVTVWDANFQKLDEKLNKINARHHAVAKQMKKDADTFTGQLEARYGSAGKAIGNVFNDSRLAVMDAGASRLRVFGSALEPLGIGGLAAAAGIAALAVAAGQAQQAMAFADEIDDASQKLNVGTTMLQEYRFAMTEVGGEAKDADEAIAAFNKTLGAAQSGLSPKAMKGFSALGIDKATLDSWDSFEDAIPRISAEISELGKESERAAVAEKLGLGPMLPLLREGTAEMERLRQKAQDMGIVMEEDLVKKGADANQQFQTLSEVIKVQMTSAFVSLSDEVVSFTSFLADAMKMFNDFMEATDRFDKRNAALHRASNMRISAWGEMAGSALKGDGEGVAQGWRNLNTGNRWYGQLWNGDNPNVAAGRYPTAAEMEVLGTAPGSRTGDGPRLTPPAPKGGGANRAAREAEQRARRQEQFDRELDRVQGELIRAYDHQFESIDADTANKLAQLQHDHQSALAEIVQREEEYSRSHGLRGLAKTEADQLRAAQDQLSATRESNILVEARNAKEDYRLKQEEEASRLTLDMLGLQQDMAATARERQDLAMKILAEEHRIARERDKAELAEDPELDDDRRAAELSRRDSGRAASYDAASRQPAHDGVVGVLGDNNAIDDQLEAYRDMYAELERMRQEAVISEEDAARAKAEIDIRYRETRLANTRTMLDTLASLQSSSNKKLAAIGKAAAIAQATIDGVLAVQKALASAPPPFNFVQAAIVGAVAAANVAQIAGFERGGYTGNGGTKQVAGVVHGQEYVFDAAATRRIGVGNLEAIRNGASMISGLNGAAAGMAGASGGGSSMTFAPTVHAPGADMAAARRIEAALEEQARNFRSNWRAENARHKRFKMGSRDR